MLSIKKRKQQIHKNFFTLQVLISKIQFNADECIYFHWSIAFYKCHKKIDYLLSVIKEE